MHIGIDARMTAIPGGHGRYITNLVHELMAIDTTNRYTLFVLACDHEYFTAPNGRWQIVIADVPWYTVREQIELPRILARYPVDLMHFPHWNVPIPYRRPFVVTIHDLTLLRFPSEPAYRTGRRATTLHPLFYAVKNFAFKRVLNYAARTSEVIITPSQFVADDIVARLRVTKEKVHTIYEGAPAPTPSNAPLPLHIREPYLLYVGVAYPHKNLERTVDAFMQYRVRSKTRTQFVLAGRITYFHQQLQKYIEKKYPHALRDHDVVFTDEVADTHLNALYHHARGFVYCSLSEGFGLPPLEALSHDVPVLASNTTCLPEILADAALLVDPMNTDRIAHGIRQLCEDAGLRTSLLNHAPEVLTRYSWQQMAREILGIYTANSSRQ